MTDPEAWVDAALGAGGRQRTGPLHLVRERPWGRVHRVPTDQGVAWLKVPGPGTRFEVALHGVLARVAPHDVLEPLAADGGAGRLLLPDGGPSLAETTADAGARLRGLEAALPRYARLQRTLAAHVDELLAAGVADMRPQRLPERLEEALELLEAEPGAGADGAPSVDADAVRAQRPALLRAAEALAAAPGGASLDHNDLHAGNLLPQRGLVAFDWGDAVVAHPFASLLVPLEATARELDCAPEDPRVRRLRDAYLEPWSDVAPAAELRETARLACAVARVVRALVWHRAAHGDPAWADAARLTLGAVTSPSPVALG